MKLTHMLDRSCKLCYTEGMNKLSRERRAQILGMMVEGMSVRAITRLTGVSKNTVAKLLVDAGRACAAFHDQAVRNVASKRIQVDEIWSFVGMKEKTAKRKGPERRRDTGDCWTWTGIDADSKSIDEFAAKPAGDERKAAASE